MKFRTVRLGLARSLVALSVSFAIVLSTHTFAFSTFAQSKATKNAAAPAPSVDASQNEFRLIEASATTTAAGILVQWHTNSAADNLGFNIYRLKDGQRLRVNQEIIPGAAFASAAARPLMRAGYSYSWFDRSGTADSTYYIESVSLAGTAKTHEAFSPSQSASGFDQMPETLSAANANAGQSSDLFVKNYPAAESGINSPTGAIEDQWAIAAQTALKIGVKKDGWYRVTQPQMAAVGFNPGDIKNLHLYVDAQEISINTSQLTGPLSAGDYIEFYGRGIDTTNADTRMYYLIAGTTPGKRVIGQIQLDGGPPDPPVPTATSTPPVPSPSPQSTSQIAAVLRDPIFNRRWTSLDLTCCTGLGELRFGSNPPVRQDDNTTAARPQTDAAPTYNSSVQPYQPDITPTRDSEPAVSDSPKQPEPVAGAADGNSKVQDETAVATKSTTTTAAKVKKAVKRSRRNGKLRKRAHSRRRATTPPQKLKQERNHPTLSLASAPANFDYTIERKDRTVYYSSLLNEDTDNFFGQVVSADPSSPTRSQTIASPNADLTAAGPAKLEIAMQGVNFVYHEVNLKFNGVSLGLIVPPPPNNYFFGQANIAATFDVPVSLLRTVNTLTFTPPLCQPPMDPCPDTTIVDYTRLTYPHQFRYDKAVGNIHLNTLPTGGDTLKVGSNTYTFTLSPTTSLEIGIGSDVAATAVNIANRINLDTAATLCAATAYPADVNLIANTGGTLGSTITLVVDGLRLARTLIADPGGMKFSLRGTQSAGADGFASSSVRLIDYTDNANVKISHLATQPSPSGFAISVPTTDPPSKPTRLLLAIADGQFNQPASILLNQPSTLNQSSNAVNYLIISYKDFVDAAEPLRLARANQGMSARVIDVEDIYDEFSFGVHGSQAIKDFLAYATTHWTTSPSYIVFFGDASLDPRNYQNVGNFDLVPTKLVDATYNETASDDWVADFHGDPADNGPDGIADIPVGRLPVRSVAEANLVVSKIINYLPATVPQTALLIADDPGTPPFWDFEEGNDNVQALLPPSITVQRVNVRTTGAAQATIQIRDGINQGRVIVNYSGHGNVNVWSGAAIWQTANATALTNGFDKLTFVIVMDCLNGYFQDPSLLSLSEAFLKAPSGGAVAAFASSGLTTTFGQRQMELELYNQLYTGQPIAVGDAIKIAKGASVDIDVRRTWIYFGDPALKIR